MEISCGILITVDNTQADVISEDSIWREGNIGTLHTHHTHHLGRAEHPEAHLWPTLQRDQIQYWQQNFVEESPLHTPRKKSCEITEI